MSPPLVSKGVSTNKQVRFGVFVVLPCKGGDNTYLLHLRSPWPICDGNSWGSDWNGGISKVLRGTGGIVAPVADRVDFTQKHIVLSQNANIVDSRTVALAQRKMKYYNF